MASRTYPLYTWPLDRVLGDGLVLVNYIDHEPNWGLLDYESGEHTYEGHAGTDYALVNFRLMDRGCAVRAAADGTVAYVGGAAPGAFDRNCTFDWTDDGNWLWIDNGDGTYSEYYHLRSWSLTVEEGDPIQRGQMLGLVGSSGYSTAPHLHFETGDYFSGPYQWRDPYTGPANPLPSLWFAQEEYQGDDPLWFVDLGVFGDDAVGGSVFQTTYCDVVEGIHAPVVFGLDEPHLDLWVQFQGNAGDPFRIEIRRPDGTEWASFDGALSDDARLDWFWAYWWWNGWVGPADIGTWTVRAFAQGVLSLERTFEVGPTTVYGPRLRRAGRSFRIQPTAQHDTLRLTPLSPSASFTLMGAPAGVSLAGAVLTVGTSSSQPNRSAYFTVVAVDAHARADTAWYHLVDMSKPPESPSGAPGPHPPPPLSGLRLHPNPVRGPAVFTLDLPMGARSRLEIFDARGRLVRTLLWHPSPGWDEASREVLWDGRDETGDRVPSGVYLARVAARQKERSARFVVVR